MLKHRAHASVPLRQVVCRCLEEIQPALKLRHDLGGGEHPCPGCRQLDAQWHPLQQLADAHHHRVVGRAQRKVMLHLACTLRK